MITNDTIKAETETTMNGTDDPIDIDLAINHLEEPLDFEPPPDGDATDVAYMDAHLAGLLADLDTIEAETAAARPSSGVCVEHHMALSGGGIGDTLIAECCQTWTSPADLPVDLPPGTRAAWTQLVTYGPCLGFKLVSLDGWTGGKPTWRTVWQIRDPRPDGWWPDGIRPKSEPKYRQPALSGTATNVVAAMRARLESGSYTHLVPIEGTKQALAVATAILAASEVWDRRQLDNLPLPDGYDPGGVDPRKIVVIGLTGCTGWCQGSRPVSTDEDELGVAA